MISQWVHLREVRRVIFAVGVLLAISTFWACREKEPEQKAGESVAESNVPETAADKPAAPKESPAVATGKIPLSVLYVGLPDTERQRDFVSFLSGHFTEVKTADYNNFREEQTGDCDVAIFDKDGLEWKALDIAVSAAYSRATVTLGVPGAFWVRRVSRRMGYM